MATATKEQEVARRCMSDPDYAKSILEGDEYPKVREALIADLQDSGEVSGYLNPQPLPPGGLTALIVMNWQPIVSSWGRINFASLGSLRR